MQLWRQLRFASILKMTIHEQALPRYKTANAKRDKEMSTTAADTQAGETSTPEQMRQTAIAHLSRADSLRLQADEEERLAWRLRAEAAIIEASGRRTNHRPRRRPAISGMPSLSINRVIALMETLCIDEDVNIVDGLDGPLSLVERHVGISYGPCRTPMIGTRIANCENALNTAAAAA